MVGNHHHTGSKSVQDVLAGRTIFIAEDEALVAMDLMDLVESVSAIPQGPFASVARCMKALDEALPDVAILDVRLTDGQIFGVADRLYAKNVPLIFHSGHLDHSDIETKYPRARFFSKPTPQRDLIAALGSALG